MWEQKLPERVTVSGCAHTTFVMAMERNKMKPQPENIIINLVRRNELYAFTRFVAEEYYNRNTPAWQNTSVPQQEIETMLHEDVKQYPYSFYYAAKKNNKIIGTIKVTKWNRKDVLPIHKLYGIDINKRKEFDQRTIWHVGRFAISTNAVVNNMILFKKLMTYAIAPICEDVTGVMVAECDCKLLRVMTALGIKTTILGKSIEYLHSETVPVCAGKEGLMGFFKKNKGV